MKRLLMPLVSAAMKFVARKAPAKSSKTETPKGK
mgnify:CR=1 FL=1